MLKRRSNTIAVKRWRTIDNPINSCTEGLTCSTYLDPNICTIAIAPEIIRLEDARAWYLENIIRVTLYGFDQNRDLKTVNYHLLNEQREALSDQRYAQLKSSIRNVEAPTLQFEITPQSTYSEYLLD